MASETTQPSVAVHTGTAGPSARAASHSPAGHAPAALLEGELRIVLGGTDEGFCVCEMLCDTDGNPVDYRFVQVNDLFEEMSGLHDAAGHTALEMVPDLERHWIDTYARVAFDRESIRFEQGSEAMGRWFDVFATPLEEPGTFVIIFRDETERHHAELALARSEEHFRALADDLPHIVWLHGPDGSLQFVNRTFCEFFGVDRATMIDDRWQPFLHPDDAEGYVEAFDAAVRRRRPFHHRARVRDAEGAWRWIESWGRPRFDAEGAFRGHIGSSVDVTDRVVAETALADASRFLRRVLDSLFTFVGVLRPDGTLIEANRAPVDAAGLSFDDVIGKKFWDCYWWDYDPAVQRRLANAIRRAALGEQVRYDERVRIADNGWLDIDLQIVPLTDPDGTITHVIPSAFDISERLAAERQRRELAVLEQQRRERAELLQAHASRVAVAVSPDQVAHAVADQLAATNGVALAAVTVHVEDERRMITAVDDGDGAEHLAAGTATDHGDGGWPRPDDVSTGVPVHLAPIESIVDRFPTLHACAVQRGIRSLLVLPARSADGTTLGALTVGSELDTFDAHLQDVLGGIADQTGQALQRALLHQRVVAANRREHEIALRLQKALLPDRLIEDPRLPIAARYEAADAHLEVGGDWYDTCQWPDGRIGIVVGDVVGHDLEAAAAMGRLRSATAALMLTLPADPVALLDALEGVALGPGGTDFVTAACVVVDPATGALTYATAGHPPPLLFSGETTRWLDDAQSPPIGSISGIERHAGSAILAPGDGVVLYTDGLVEHRGRRLDLGLAMLEHSVRRNADTDVTRLLDEVVGDLSVDGFGDDVVAVVFRRST